MLERTIFGPTNREVSAPSWMSGAVEVGHITITYNRLWIICFSLAVFVALLDPDAATVPMGAKKGG